MLTIHIQEPSFQTIQKIDQNKSEILREGGEAIRELVADHLRQLDATRHKGGTTHHFDPEDALRPELHGNFVDVEILTPGINRAYHSIDIYPVEANALAIPLSDVKMAPREYSLYSSDKLFAFTSKKGNRLLARKDGKNTVLMYVLKEHVHQNQDPSLMPTDQALEDAYKESVQDAIDIILSN